MGEGSIREDQAWMLQSRINPFPISGALELRDGRISFTLNAMAAEASLGWLEEELGVQDLKAKIEAGETVVAFDCPLSECKVSWPLTGGGAMMFVETPRRKWVVSYDYPSGGAVSQTMSLLSGRKKAKEWKKALAAAEA
jgi:hypothetical protein